MSSRFDTFSKHAVINRCCESKTPMTVIFSVNDNYNETRGTLARKLGPAQVNRARCPLGLVHSANTRDQRLDATHVDPIANVATFLDPGADDEAGCGCEDWNSLRRDTTAD